ncbi:Methyltransferase-like protein [Thalictrum thalictroides]|uniref:Methyltransferase-like protein n=1 Tax=Thalictrum thalictroides TaxID=46969 RepID=A0A7J6WIZ6_THATH|nr:Methyltransferase-like protein [Thalictrum thalictroides]
MGRLPEMVASAKGNLLLKLSSVDHLEREECRFYRTLSRMSIVERLRDVLSKDIDFLVNWDTSFTVLGLTWGEWKTPIFSIKPKVVLGADVLYDAKNFDDLFATVSFLLHNSPGAVFITTYHNRSGHHLIEYLMVKWSLKCTKLVDAYSFMPSCKASSITGNIQLAEIMLDDSTT